VGQTPWFAADAPVGLRNGAGNRLAVFDPPDLLERRLGEVSYKTSGPQPVLLACAAPFREGCCVTLRVDRASLRGGYFVLGRCAELEDFGFSSRAVGHRLSAAGPPTRFPFAAWGLQSQKGASG
jgi:hypothetical protein